MKRSLLNFWVDTVAFVMFVFMVATGVIMEFLLPAGSGHATTIWSIDRHGWGAVHFWMSVVFLAALALHVYLHWRWIVAVLRGRPREGSGVRLGLGVLGLAALLALAVAPIVTPVERDAAMRGNAEPRWGLSAEAEALQGSTTLSDVVQTTGVSLDNLVLALNLPPVVSLDDRLGQLARENGFSVADVREVVETVLSGGNVVARQNDVAPFALAADTNRMDTRPPATDALEERRPLDEHFAEGHEDGQAGLAEIRGATTLSELVQLGVPLATLLRELGLPAGTPASERLGRLGRTYGFTLTEVRDLVESYR